ncbi:segregation and condensation protein B [Actinopolymorpha cephalotaxi]|uniref:Segregation and condensation protein B n=1 Tax=Actinopolymorpha cephalotaxi TaxID=504797 RepID=A0A1I2VPN1_9ACTN|nr:SMC-Scp complex subunit ScpB [Actinopolymorpha cephalotaxi]NYH83227.1 segregation and condensation protein B [Actinopolymorpha cephalotaxi]SFG91090.1 segregation and condensation protein B [Actinopolymorpha cephalotaxi]
MSGADDAPEVERPVPSTDQPAEAAEAAEVGGVGAPAEPTEGTTAGADEQAPVDEGTGEQAAVDGEQAPIDEQAAEAPADDEAEETLDVVVPGDLHGPIEAILLIVDEPLSPVTLAQVLGRPRPDIDEALRTLSAEYTLQERGFDLREVAGGWRLYTREEYAEIVQRFVLDGQQAKLTQAALETLAVVAYKQPVSRARVSAIRGVNCDGVMRTLVTRGLVEEAGAEGESNATLYRTTSYFLERLGVRSLEELPDLAPYLPDIDEMEAEQVSAPAEVAPSVPAQMPLGDAEDVVEPAVEPEAEGEAAAEPDDDVEPEVEDDVEPEATEAEQQDVSTERRTDGDG